jgi:hypothetical protein
MGRRLYCSFSLLFAFLLPLFFLNSLFVASLLKKANALVCTMVAGRFLSFLLLFAGHCPKTPLTMTLAGRLRRTSRVRTWSSLFRGPRQFHLIWAILLPLFGTCSHFSALVPSFRHLFWRPNVTTGRYDVTAEETFRNVPKWKEDIDKKASLVPCALCMRRCVSFYRGQAWPFGLGSLCPSSVGRMHAIARVLLSPAARAGVVSVHWCRRLRGAHSVCPAGQQGRLAQITLLLSA